MKMIKILNSHATHVSLKMKQTVKWKEMITHCTIRLFLRMIICHCLQQTWANLQTCKTAFNDKIKHELWKSMSSYSC